MNAALAIIELMARAIYQDTTRAGPPWFSDGLSEMDREHYRNQARAMLGVPLPSPLDFSDHA